MYDLIGTKTLAEYTAIVGKGCDSAGLTRSLKLIEESFNIVLPLSPVGGEPNRNGIVYPKRVLNNAIKKYIEKSVDVKRALVINRPFSGNLAEIALNDVCAAVTKIEKVKNQYFIHLHIVDTPRGRKMVMDHCMLGFTGIGLNSLANVNKKNKVSDLTIISMTPMIGDEYV